MVEWLLDVWGVDFEAAQLRDLVYSLSDHACGGGGGKGAEGEHGGGHESVEKAPWAMARRMHGRAHASVRLGEDHQAGAGE
mmetsp:Transcript_11865/g.29860  ORF Transcript_11865/g.29860 Transcript_11865/m.29860 type:complete len:81 (+) Transcript_11865:2098-2340(+)